MQFKINFVAVPAFKRVEPVSTSGPIAGATMRCGTPARRFNFGSKQTNAVRAPRFAAAAIAVVVAGRGNDTTALAAQAYFWARVVYLPLYAAGVPYVRSLVWLVSLLSILALVFALL